jgi:hypothetical protein
LALSGLGQLDRVRPPGRRRSVACHALPADEVRLECYDSAASDPGLLVCDPPAFYRPRHPEAQGFFQVFEQHFDSYVAAYEERFEARSGPLRRVVSRW